MKIKTNSNPINNQTLNENTNENTAKNTKHRGQSAKTNEANQNDLAKSRIARKVPKLYPSKPSNNLVSIVVPAYKESGNIKTYPEKLLPYLDKLPYKYELIIVDDGSNDKSPNDETWDELVKLYNMYPDKVSIIRHARNYGMTSAMQTGVNASRGDYIIFYSADLEIHPKEITNVIEKLDEGYDFVNTARQKRWSESGINKLIRQIPSKFANRLANKVLNSDITDNGSGLKGYKRFILDNFKLYGEIQRLMASYTSFYTKRYIEIPVEYYERTFGQSAYGGIKGLFRRTFAVFFDLAELKFMTTFSTKPFTLKPGRAFGFSGILVSLLGALITLYMIGIKLLTGASIGSRPLFIMGLIFVVLGVQLVIMGMLGELLIRIYYESSSTKNFVVAEEHLAKN